MKAKEISKPDGQKPPPPVMPARFRDIVDEHATPERVKEVLDRLHQMAAGGDIAAIRLYLDIARDESHVGVW